MSLLTTKNLRGPVSGQGVASLCSKTFSDSIFTDKLQTKMQAFQYLKAVPNARDITTLLVDKLATQCLSETSIDSLQRGLEAGSHFKAEWIIGNKGMKATLREVSAHIASTTPGYERQEHKITTELKACVISAFQETFVSIAEFNENGELLTFIAESFKHLDVLPHKQAKLSFLRRYGVHDQVRANLPEALKLINAIDTPPALVKKRTDQTRIAARFKKNLLYFISDKLSAGEDSEKLSALCVFFGKLFASEKLELYMRAEYDNDLTLITAIWQAIKSGLAELHVITCPDYSGYIDESGVWNFDFLKLNAGEGIVAKKSYGLTLRLYTLLDETGVRIKITHSLPFFEFKNGFQGEEALTPDQVRARLNLSLTHIKDFYQRNNINANTISTETMISNEQFFAKVNETKSSFRNRHSSEADFKAFLEETFKKRLPMYSKWYPKNGESEQEYFSSLKEKLWDQLVEYYVETSFLNDGKTILIFADSPQMSQAYAFWKIPAFCGHDTSAVQYVG